MAYKGWVVRMKKKMIKASREDAGILAYQEAEKEQPKYVNFFAYGDFDYLQFVPVNSWNEYHKGFLISDWVGQRQTVMLFRLENSDSDEQIDSYILKDTENAKKGRFHVLTMLHLSNAIKDTGINFKQILLEIKKAVSDFIALYPLNDSNILKFDVYGTFSSSEIAIIWSVSQYTDVINILNYLQYFYYVNDEKKERVFISSYTIVASNEFYEGRFEEVEGNALAQIELSSALNIEDIIDKFPIHEDVKKELDIPGTCEVKIMSSIGKPDFIVQFPAQNLPKESNGRKFIGSKATTLIQEEENEHWRKIVLQNKEKLKIDIQCSKKQLKKLDSQLKAHWDACNSILKEIAPYDPRFEFQELLFLMFGDYKRVISSSVDQKWLADYEEQFKTIIEIISKDVEKIKEEISKLKNPDKARLLNSNNKSMPNFIEKLSERCAFMSGVMQQQVNHILESSKLFFASPNSNIGYTAQFDLMLHMYYGIIKLLISDAYKFRNNSWQYSLVPVVTFMNEPVLGSAMIYAADNSLETNRLIQFKFPCDAWANPLFYLPYLVHEVYHYITPYDRVHRNESFLTIALTEIGVKYFIKIAEFAESKYNVTDCRRYAIKLKSLMKYRLYSHIAQEADELLLTIEKESKYRDMTFQFDKYQLSDMPIYQLEKAFFNWSSKSSSNFYDWIQTAISEIKTNNLNFDINQEELEFLEELDKKMIQAKKEIKIPSLEKENLKIIHTLFHYLREIYADCAMIQHLGMGVSEYLVQVAVQLSNKLILPLKLTSKTASDWISMIAIRIAPIVEYFGGEDRLKDYESSFCTLYTNTLHTIRIPIEKSDQEINYVEMAKEWFKFFEKCYDEYKEEYSIYTLEFRNQIKNYLKDMKPLENLHNLYQEYWKVVHEEDMDSESAREDLFDLSLRLVLGMQEQVSISEINQRDNLIYNKRTAFETTSVRKIQMNPKCIDPVTYVLHDGFGNLMDILYNIVNDLDRYHNEIFKHHLGSEDLWYRGISNETYHILPSLYRKYVEKDSNVVFDSTTNTTNISLEQLQHHLLQRFRYQADGAPEIINQAVYRNSDYLALMQHYQLPTNLLDWSEDVFAALYFALESYIKDEDGKNEDKKNNKACPAIYFLDPQAYNRARKEMIKEVCTKDGKTCSRLKECEAFKRQQVLMEDYRELVPNISVQVNEDIMEDYFCAKYVNKDKKGNIHKQDESSDLLNHPGEAHCEFCKLPVAYYCSRLSPRIRAQSGQFLAFSLDINPRWKEDKEYEKNNQTPPLRKEERLTFDYMALDKIQEYYLNGKETRHPFMLKLVIPNEYCKDLAKLLRKFGIKTIKYYPELTNLKK